MKKGIGSLILAMSFLVLSNMAIAQCGGGKSTSSTSDCKSGTSKIALVKFSSDNCGACQKLEPKITELKGKLTNGVVFVKFDFTNDESKAKTKTFASEQGLSSVLESNTGTGYILVYDLKNQKVLAKLDNTQSTDDMEKTVLSYL
jgi:thiol-disulfide isomerase/thioredoxin